MRLLWEIFTVLVGIGVIFALGKGFPQFGQVLRFFLHPLGLVLVAGIVIWMILIRKRTAARRARQSSD